MAALSFCKETVFRLCSKKSRLPAMPAFEKCMPQIHERITFFRTSVAYFTDIKQARKLMKIQTKGVIIKK
jgi:hypothetical protein